MSRVHRSSGLTILTPNGVCVFQSELTTSEGAAGSHFDFLRNRKSPEHAYYRWKVAQLLCPEDGRGPSPTLRSSSSSSLEKDVVEPTGKGQGSLPEQVASSFSSILDGLTPECASVHRASAFVLDHPAHAQEELVRMLCDRAGREGSPQALAVAHLYLASDLLHQGAKALSGRAARLLRSEAEPIALRCWECAAEGKGLGRIEKNGGRQRATAVARSWRRAHLLPEGRADRLLNDLGVKPE